MAEKKSAKDKALEDIAAMDKKAPEKKANTSTRKTTKPKATKPSAEDPNEKEVGWKEAEVVGDKIIMQEKDIQTDLDKAAKDFIEQSGFDPDDEDAPEPPETEKLTIITTKNIPPEQRFNKVSPVIKAEKTRMITTKTMKDFLPK